MCECVRVCIGVCMCVRVLINIVGVLLVYCRCVVGVLWVGMCCVCWVCCGSVVGVYVSCVLIRDGHVCDEWHGACCYIAVLLLWL